MEVFGSNGVSVATCSNEREWMEKEVKEVTGITHHIMGFFSSFFSSLLLFYLLSHVVCFFFSFLFFSFPFIPLSFLHWFHDASCAVQYSCVKNGRKEERNGKKK
ncbi:hypothetical protein, unlikely [Trypanosoma brucei gambiense DAL972]|uniref:Uncharacterized protein n=1 Tax=Trypanosoma brucei gambiense (strain MHOM/CI/86/DAL972) TaxID=679716 RepID=C9ZVQ2_TRYB9|nr:hypothetical protein, unlikely [Trypanosoma brucei gambiense DAL972]CBH13490.1 hypothetical protein, unlikely [Trypanosoma brucei gambiense DAL972]|eukprot:XP_011775767.1 hypothetical protein, unlikely [Trypanosoma brucei gambiense DAL972]